MLCMGSCRQQCMLGKFRLGPAGCSSCTDGTMGWDGGGGDGDGGGGGGGAGSMSMQTCLAGVIEESFLGYKSGKSARVEQEEALRLS